MDVQGQGYKGTSGKPVCLMESQQLVVCVPNSSPERVSCLFETTLLLRRGPSTPGGNPIGKDLKCVPTQSHYTGVCTWVLPDVNRAPATCQTVQEKP